jgi:hypothetical protein
MRKKFLTKLGILGLTVIFLLSMSSYIQSKKKGKGAKKLYRISISINDTEAAGTTVPGFENLDNVDGEYYPYDIIVNDVPHPVYTSENSYFTCSPCTPTPWTRGYFYAEGNESEGYEIFRIDSKGRDTPGPFGEVAPLNMRINLLEDESIAIRLEECDFWHGEDPLHRCHGEINCDRGPGFFILTIFEREPDPDPNNEEISVYWAFDYEQVPPGETAKGPKKFGRGWRIYSIRQPGKYVHMTEPFPEVALNNVGDTWWTDVIGKFVLFHDGRACIGGEEGVNSTKELIGDFNIRIFIERVQ